ncbi:MAG: o-succinylbenzoate synthase [Sedimenticola sp.]|nr:o-succinylbenzoate synthase [Sedimenticola sp.]
MPPWSARLTPYRLPFRHPWSSHAGAWRERCGWLLKLTDDRGNRGYGDAAPLPEMGSETPGQCEAWLRSNMQGLRHLAPELALENLANSGGHPAARCALECALLDLQGQQQQRPLWQLLGVEEPQPVVLNAALGELDETATTRARNALTAGFDTLKLKIGIHPESQELAHLQQLAAELPDSVYLRLDANRAWNPNQALAWIQRLNDLPVESLEEPLARWDDNTMAQLQQAARFDLAADESLTGFLRQRPLAALPVRRVVLKPALLGGLLPARDLIRQAAPLGLHCVITSCLESSAGLWPLLHLAAFTDQVTGPTAHGLATGDLFSHDLGHAPAIEQGRVRVGECPGSGFILRRDTPNQHQE